MTTRTDPPSGWPPPADAQLGTATLDLGSRSANAHASAHAYVPTLRQTLARRPTLIAFYVGRDDDRFRDENERLDRELSDAGVPHVFRLYPGGHDQGVWAKHAPESNRGLQSQSIVPSRPIRAPVSQSPMRA